MRKALSLLFALAFAFTLPGLIRAFRSDMHPSQLIGTATVSVILLLCALHFWKTPNPPKDAQ